jgi:NTE family protein
MSNSPELWLCLSGGNALGAYHVGAYSVLHEARLYPTRIAGASVGAIVGALIAGNKIEDRLCRLDEFWNIAADEYAFANLVPHWGASKIASSLGTLLHGRSGLFAPSLSQWWRRIAGLSSPSLFERTGLREKLQRLVDFERLNNGQIRLIINAVDVTTGIEAIFDTAETTITVDHLMASSAFPVLYSPQPMGESHMVDGGLASNLPILHLFRDTPSRPVACLALDLVSAHGRVPASLDDAVHRMQDLVLSNQSRRSIELLGHRLMEAIVEVSLLHVAYQGNSEVGGKMLDFSSASMKSRHYWGEADGTIALRWLQDDEIPVDSAPHVQRYKFGPISGRTEHILRE